MKLWFDDERPAPAGWHWAKTVEEAKEAFLTGEVTDAALDHDMGLDGFDREAFETIDDMLDAIQALNIGEAPNGMHLARWLNKHPELIPPEVNIHSWNPDGAMAMAIVLSKHCHVTIEPFVVKK